MLKNAFQIEIDIEKIIQSFDCIALVTDQDGKILLVNNYANKLFSDWNNKYLSEFTDYDKIKVKQLYSKIKETKSVFNWEMFFTFNGTLTFLETTVFILNKYCILLATENSSKIDYLNTITTLTGEVNLLNQKLSKKNREYYPQDKIYMQNDQQLSITNQKNNYSNQTLNLDNGFKKIVYNDFEICAVTRKVTVKGRQVRLTAREFELLWLMASNINQIFTRNHLLNTIWEANYSGDDNTVTVHIRRLRKKIEDNPNKPRYIKTVWGVGYRFEIP